MKRYNNLFEKIIDVENIKLAHKNASKGKRHYRAVKEVDNNLDECIKEIQEMLRSKTYNVSEYTISQLKDKGKERIIYKLPYFPDRILHHAILQILDDIWKKTFIVDTYQSIKGRGLHKCKNKIEKISKNSNIDNLYCLKIDITKFYPSVDNEILKDIVRKKIKCKDTLWLLDNIIDSSKGLPIGNYISQHLGNLYLTYLDHKMKEKYSCKWYFRYCDDIVILSDNKKFLYNIKHILFKETYKLNLSIKNNYQVFKIDTRPLDFLGFQFFRNRTLLRKSIATNFKKCKPKKQIFMAYYGWIKYSDSFNLWKKYFKIKKEN